MPAIDAASTDSLERYSRTSSNYTRKSRKTFRSLRFAAAALVVVAAVAVLISTLLMPVLRVYGGSMSPTISEGDTVVCLALPTYGTGDVVSFYYNNKVLVKRVVATAGSWVDIDDEGNVYIDGQLLDEPYLNSKALGECDITLPCQVPDGYYFVMGDNRATSTDSRSSEIGFVSNDDIVGRAVFTVWPFSSFGPVG